MFLCRLRLTAFKPPSSRRSRRAAMTHVARLLAVVFTSSVLSCTAAEASVLCTWTKVLPNEEVHYSFVHSDPRRASPSLRLYHSAWSGERALLSCAWSDDAATIQTYISACRERAQDFFDYPGESLDVQYMLEEEDLCVSLASPGGLRGERTGTRTARSVGGSPPENRQGQAEGSEVRTHQRVKRGFIVPGTLWCGSGNKAPSYADLGVFAETDSCCREHDQCKDTILSFHSEFGVFNSNIFTMSHCDCDNKFRSCLVEASDRISDVVGYTFFNLLKMQCFEFAHRLQCTERNWFGMCKESKMALYADVQPPRMYWSANSTVDSMNTTSSIINSTSSIINSTSSIINSTMAPESSTSDPQPFSITAALSTVPSPPTSSPSASTAPDTHVTTSTVTSTSDGPTGPEPERRGDLENTLSTRTQPQPELDAENSERQLPCAVYKDLDKCRTRILPQQRRYGLHNPGATTLYHCNCTTRLFQTLSKQRQLTEEQAVLLGHVSQSCFLPQDCTAGNVCTAVLVKAELPQLDQRSGADMEEQRHLQAVRLKVRRPNTRSAKRKDRAVRLHKLCLRMLRPRVNNTRIPGPDARWLAVRQRVTV